MKERFWEAGDEFGFSFPEKREKFLFLFENPILGAENNAGCPGTET
jgi:hypothetical protein